MGDPIGIQNNYYVNKKLKYWDKVNIKIGYCWEYGEEHRLNI